MDNPKDLRDLARDTLRDVMQTDAGADSELASVKLRAAELALTMRNPPSPKALSNEELADLTRSWAPFGEEIRARGLIYNTTTRTLDERQRPDELAEVRKDVEEELGRTRRWFVTTWQAFGGGGRQADG